mmetsp:Transcript_128039/g.190784  ORF Transcript_128039/g.190784 Transcript_128039/m.190784 type:complete len:87 (-) Transcript_128039:100-360(-)
MAWTERLVTPETGWELLREGARRMQPMSLNPYFATSLSPIHVTTAPPIECPMTQNLSFGEEATYHAMNSIASSQSSSNDSTIARVP